MSNESKTTVVLVVLIGLFLGLQDLFFRDLWGHAPTFPPATVVDAAFIKPGTVRRSAAERIRDDGTVEEFDCYACHEKGKEPVIKIGPDLQVIIPEEHKDLQLRHGRFNRNANCYNCHDPKKLDQLRTKDGKTLTFSESTRLCASCHGPTYRDWEVGIHGRLNGYWDRQRGEATKKDCTSCHNPHAPMFPEIKPAPGPTQVENKGPKHKTEHQ